MTRLGYVQFTLFLLVVVAFTASPDAERTPCGHIMALHALSDGTALVAWRGNGADYITHMRSDGRVLTAEIAEHRLDPNPFHELDTVADDHGTYHGKQVILEKRAIAIGGVEHEIPLVMVPPVEFVPARLQSIAGELPQFIGVNTVEGPLVLDLENGNIAYRGDGTGLAARDGANVYIVGYQRIEVFDPRTRSTTLVTDWASPDQIGGGYVWTYDEDVYAIDEPVVHAIRPEAVAAVTARR